MTGVEGEGREQDWPCSSHKPLGHSGASQSFPPALPGGTLLASGRQHQKGSMLAAFYQTFPPEIGYEAIKLKLAWVI